MDRAKSRSLGNVSRKRKRNFHQYFDSNYGTLTPNRQSLAKDRRLLYRSRQQSTHKPAQKPLFHDSPPPRPQLRQPRISELEQSLNRQYDSPSRDHDEMDLLLGKRPQLKPQPAARGKSQAVIAEIQDRINFLLRKNQLDEAITLLRQTLPERPRNSDLKYLLGICYVFKGLYPEAQKVFEELLADKPSKKVFLLLSVCHKKNEDFPATEAVLNECVRKYPKYYEAHIYRGKLFLKLKDFRKALADFEKAVALDSHRAIGLIGKGDALRLLGRYEEARQTYLLASSKSEHSSLFLRKAICQMESRRFDAALDEVNQLLRREPENSEALYFKGLILSKLSAPCDAGQNAEACICYEQAVKFNSNKRAVTRSIYEIAKFQIEAREYYEAFYTLERAQHLDIDERVLHRFCLFTNGITALMKKNYAEGVRVLNELATDPDRPLSNFLKPLFYSTRAYGHMAQEKFLQAKEDLEDMEKEFALDLQNLYNKFICEGILCCNAQKYEQALALFSKAGRSLPHRVDPAYYKAVTLVSFAMRLIPRELREKRKEYIENALRSLSKVEHLPFENQPSLYLIRGLLKYATGDLVSALEDLEKCWNESPKLNPFVSYLIGLIFGESGRFSEAIAEFRRTIENDRKNEVPEAYLARAKCQILLGDVKAGFLDLQTYMAHRPSSPEIHIWAGHLLFHIGAFQDAALAYSNLSNLQRHPEVLQFRAHCFVAANAISEAISAFKAVLDQSFDSRSAFDYSMLFVFRELAKEESSDITLLRLKMKDARQKSAVDGKCFGRIFEEADYQFLKAISYFYEGDYSSAIKNFERALKAAEAKVEFAGKADSSLLDFYRPHSQAFFFNYFELNYAIILAEILHGNLPKASRILRTLLEKTGQESIGASLQHLLKRILKEIASQFEQKGVPASGEELLLFQTEGRICELFPQIILPLNPPIKTLLSFGLPFVPKPDITPRFEEKLLEELSMASIEVRPEAPWIRRTEQGFVFTDQLIKCDIELSQSSDKNPNEQEEEEELELHGEEMGQYEGYEEEYSSFDPGRLKEMLKLDSKVEEKLARLKNMQ